jgi:hypothetical protein
MGTKRTSQQLASSQKVSGPTGGVSNAFLSGIRYVTPGTYAFTVPTGVTSISVLAIGGGGGGRSGGNGPTTGGTKGGGGGALAYVNNYPVSAGQQYTVVVGEGGRGDSNESPAPVPNGLSGGDSYFNSPTFCKGGGGAIAPSLDIASGAGGAGGTYTVNPTAGSSRGGGNGGAGGGILAPLDGTSYPGRGAGGGGAGGYSGTGGAGGNIAGNGAAGGGGGGGGGSGNYSPGAGVGGAAAGGGGVGIFGSGPNGAAGTGSLGTPSALSVINGGGGGSGGGTAATINGPAFYDNGGDGGLYGGGGGGTGLTPLSPSPPGRAGNGASGAVRIIWPGSRTFPTTGVGDLGIEIVV